MNRIKLLILLIATIALYMTSATTAFAFHGELDVVSPHMAGTTDQYSGG